LLIVAEDAVQPRDAAVEQRGCDREQDVDRRRRQPASACGRGNRARSSRGSSTLTSTGRALGTSSALGMDVELSTAAAAVVNGSGVSVDSSKLGAASTGHGLRWPRVV
jgi:hypothetical protein